jgi:DMSO/TMAO reductase YedYZ molybdopterin-dependent catalytic subunit
MTNRLDVRTWDRDRLPPGQIVTRKWPVLHYGTVPIVDPTQWSFAVSGEVEQPFTLTWQDLQALPRQETMCDIHCVTRWSRYDNLFEGVAVLPLMMQARPKPDATHVLIHAEHGFTTNLPLEDFMRPANLLALRHNGQDLDPEHGGPVRLVVPHLYFWKSAKWVRGVEFLVEDYPGFWEQNGYHMRGEPWAEERFGRRDPVRMRRGPRR